MASKTRPGHPFMAGAPLLFAHRGGAQIAPENTMVAFRQAVELWEADVLELDVHMTSDGKIVVIHDPTVDRTCDATGTVSELPFDALRQMDAGYHFQDPSGRHSFRGSGAEIPLLEEVLETFPNVRVNMEIKDPRAADSAVKVVRRFSAEQRVLVGAIDSACRESIRGYTGPWGASQQDVLPFWGMRKLRLHQRLSIRYDALQLPEFWKGLRIISPALIRDAKALNLPVHVWTVNEQKTMRRLLAWGVDGIQSDRPDLLAEVLVREAGRPVPPGLAQRRLDQEDRSAP